MLENKGKGKGNGRFGKSASFLPNRLAHTSARFKYTFALLYHLS